MANDLAKVLEIPKNTHFPKRWQRLNGGLASAIAALRQVDVACAAWHAAVRAACTARLPQRFSPAKRLGPQISAQLVVAIALWTVSVSLPMWPEACLAFRASARYSSLFLCSFIFQCVARFELNSASQGMITTIVLLRGAAGR